MRGVLSFEEFELDRDRGQLLKAGEPVPLRPQCFDVLCVLVEQAGALVTKDALLEAVWPGRVVTDDSISHCIAEIRAALGDTERSKIRTVPRRGFVFQLNVAEISSPGAAQGAPIPGSSTTWRWVGLLILLAVIAVLVVYWPRERAQRQDTLPAATAEAPGAEGEVTLAVLPFVDMSPDGDQGQMADGLTEELIMELVQVDGLLVSGRSSVNQFRDRSEDYGTIGEALGVDHVLEGSVRRSGDQLRITAQLVELDGGFSLWSDTFDRPMDDYFVIQDEIAQAVTAALRITFGFGGANNPYATDSIPAYELLREADELIWREGEASQVAIEKLRLALELDPDYAFVQARLAEIYSILGEVAHPNWREETENLLEASIEANPDSPWPLFNAAMIHARLGDVRKAGRLLNEAEGRADFVLPLPRADFMLKMGQVTEALRVAQSAHRRDPLFDPTRMYLAHTLALNGRLEESLEQWAILSEVEQITSGMTDQGLMAALSLGDPDVIASWLEQTMARNEPHASYAVLEQHIDNPPGAAGPLREIWEDPELGPDERWQLVNFAAWSGDTELTMDIIEYQFDAWPIWMPHFAAVRSTDRFTDWLRVNGFVDYWEENGWADRCWTLETGDIRCD